MTDRKLIIFDFDGTLVNSQIVFDVALKDFSESLSMPWDAQKMAVGYVDPNKYDLGWNLSLVEQQAMFDQFCAFMDKRWEENDPSYIPVIFEHTLNVLQELKQSYDLGIITARNRHGLLQILEHYKMLEFFPHYRTHCCAKDRGYPIKPMPDAVHCMVTDTQHSLENIIIVGDTTADIGMANAAGTKSIAVLWGAHPREKLQTEKPTLMLEEMAGLPAAIRQLFAN